MKSVHVTCAAVCATVATLGAVTSLGRTDAVLSSSYDHALSSRNSAAALVAAAHAPGSEHYWLSQAGRRHDENGGSVTPTANRATTPAVSDAQIKQALAATADARADDIELVRVQEVPRAVIGSAVSNAARALLVTARISTTVRGQAGHLVRFVVDVPTGGTDTIARAL